MSTREIAIGIVNALSEEQLQAFITLFGSDKLKDKALDRLMKELDAGKESGDPIAEKEVLNRLGVEL